MRRAACVMAVALMLAGCERAMHDMYDQPRYRPLRPAPALPQGTSSQPLPASSVVHSGGGFAGTSSGAMGEEETRVNARSEAAQAMPLPMSPELLQRGRERYTIYCAPCHSPIGDGDGRVVERGFPRPPSYHIDRLREATDRHFYDVITDGYGIMYSYADRVSPPDRWAIVAYVRALQLSQHADTARLPPDVRAKLPER